jgi:RNA polymerase sigma-70 factor (ECF subfamily)
MATCESSVHAVTAALSRAGLGVTPDVADLAVHAVADTTMRWPTLSFDPRLVARVVSDACGSVAQPQERRALRLGDLVLARACLEGDPQALRLFDAEILDPLVPQLAALGSPRSEIDEVLQALRVRMLTGCEPKLASFVGRSSLKRWVRVSAVRLLRRQTEGTTPLDLSAGFVDLGPDPEIAYFKQLYRSKFREAFARAVEQLTHRERNLLRYHLIDRLTIDQIGRIYHLSRASAARHVARARTRLAETTLAIMRRDLDLGEAELRSVMRAIRSRLDVSVVRLLGARPRKRSGATAGESP